VEPFPEPGPLPVCPSLPQPIFDPGTGDMSWDLSFPDSESGSQAWVSAALKFSPGRSGLYSPSQLIWTGDATDGVIDLGSSLSAAFGGAVSNASAVRTVMRYAVPSGMR